jgi:hypothetical protein
MYKIVFKVFKVFKIFQGTLSTMASSHGKVTMSERTNAKLD